MVQYERRAPVRAGEKAALEIGGIETVLISLQADGDGIGTSGLQSAHPVNVVDNHPKTSGLDS